MIWWISCEHDGWENYVDGDVGGGIDNEINADMLRYISFCNAQCWYAEIQSFCNAQCRDAKSGRYGRYICAILSNAVLIFVPCNQLILILQNLYLL